MGSTFAGQALFDSGPHRFQPRSFGRVWAEPYRLDGLQEKIVVGVYVRELHIDQLGRLIADDDDDLWALVDAIAAEAEAGTTGALVEGSGRTWADMTLLRFSTTGLVARGRRVSLGYAAQYVRLIDPVP